MTSRAFFVCALLVCLAAAAPGCAQLKSLTSNPEDISVQQAQRTAETVQAFEARRDYAQFMAAQARWREGNLPACRDSLKQLLQRNPQYFDARLLLAETLLSEEKFDPAREHLAQAIAERPNDARAQHLLGLVLQSQGRESEALACFQRAAELEPGHPRYEPSCQAAANAFPEHQALHSPASDLTAQTTVHFKTSGQPPGAQSLSRAEQALAEASRALAIHDLAKGQALLSEALAAEPDDAHVAVRAAVLALRHEQPDIAVFLLQPAAGRFFDTVAIHRTLGAAYYRQGDYEAALHSLERAVSLDKSNALAYLLMGCTVEKLGQSATAKAHFEQARRLDPRLSVQH